MLNYFMTMGGHRGGFCFQKIFISDKVHFKIGGCVNKQN